MRTETSDVTSLTIRLDDNGNLGAAVSAANTDNALWTLARTTDTFESSIKASIGGFEVFLFAKPTQPTEKTGANQ